ncbi:MAG: class I SAM-dependent methyltransferase [Gammaproteobacteria bacterium]|nr:class I SAM-dependent methyltransferase [Gammaproteobacteria bacterium]
MTKVLPIIVFGITLMLSCAVSADIYDDAVSNTSRSDKDKELDERRKPAEVMRFFEIEPGMQVLDVFAGGGYYSELLSYLVGPVGSITLYNNEPWDKFVDKAVSVRLDGDRLPNVTRLVATPESLVDLREQYDAAVFILGMHDLYYADPGTGWVAIDKAKFLKGIYQRLRDGAVFGVIDANAEAGADNEVIGEKLHRVDPAAVIRDVEAAGFKLEASSDILSNPNDDKTALVFLPENRYRTDRSVLKFRK